MNNPICRLRRRQAAVARGELQRHARALGRSAADRERALAATRRFTADAGHELRTPRTSVQATLSALSGHRDIPSEQRVALVREALAEDPLDGLQALARGEAAAAQHAQVDLAEPVAASVEAAAARHRTSPGPRSCPTRRSS